MSIWKAALLGLMIPTALVLPAVAQDGGPRGGPEMIFEEFDLNGDGSVTLEELEGAREARFAQADTNGDGVLDRDELLAAATQRAERGVDRMIERLDGDGDGAITAEEMAEMRGARRGPDAERMLERFDADGDGAVTQEEFEEAIAEMRERGGRGSGFWRGHDRG